MNYGKWTVLDRADARRWWARCECGTVRAVVLYHMKVGKSTSCGCAFPPHRLSHGHTTGKLRSKEHIAWMNMLQRVRPNYIEHDRYHDRGIRVCERWHAFVNFLDDMGERPADKTSLDRIDNAKGYEPGNCRWATAKEQANNRRKARRRLPIGSVAGQTQS